VSKEWCHSSLPKPVQFHTQTSVGKAMLTLYWDHQGPLVEHYMSQGTKVTSALSYAVLRNHLIPAIRSKHCGLHSIGVLWLHDTLRPHAACVRAETIMGIHFECLPYLPYCSDFTHCDYHIFWATQGGSWSKDFPIQQSAEGSECMSDYTCTQRIFSQVIEALVKMLEDML
jgi:hypothetical protein